MVLLVSIRLELDGTPYSVEVEGKTVRINCREYSVEGKGSTVEVDGTPYTVEMGNGEVIVNGISHVFRVESRRAGKVQDSRRVSGAGAVTAMMPGRIVNVLVKEGDAVKEGDKVCILEAMKMENELRASRSGTVRKVHIAAGANVDKGDALVEIE